MTFAQDDIIMICSTTSCLDREILKKGSDNYGQNNSSDQGSNLFSTKGKLVNWSNVHSLYLFEGEFVTRSLY